MSWTITLQLFAALFNVWAAYLTTNPIAAVMHILAAIIFCVSAAIFYSMRTN